MYIEKNLWHISKIDGASIKDLTKKYGGSGKYYTDVFKAYLKDLNIELVDYFTKFCKIKQPVCQCGICKKPCRICKVGSNFKWSERACGRSEGVTKWSKEAKISRLGKNNPMFGKASWNKNLRKETNKSLSTVSQKLTNRKISKETKQKQSESAKKRLVHGHTGCKHSEENKEKQRQRTLQRIKNGDFGCTRTLPHVEFCSFLKDLNIEYEEEKIVECWAFDIYIKKYDLYIEIDGDYWHSNPYVYPNGPKTKSQKINYYRDKKKNEFCKKHSLKLYRFWERDILNKKEEIICNLKKLFQ
jgi:G:T-mismatch repair DNA endonuclease (very short patch repair protein)